MDEAATPASTSPERNSPALFRTSLIEPNAYVVPKRTVFSFTAAPRKKRCPEAARRGWRRPGRGWTGLPPRAWGCGGLREAGMCGGKRPRPRGAPLPEGPLAGRATLRPARLPGLRHTGTGSGHIPKIQSLSDTPTGKGFQSQPPSGGRKSRRDALSANTATAPRGERLQPHLPRLLRQARRPRGERHPARFPERERGYL